MSKKNIYLPLILGCVTLAGTVMAQPPGAPGGPGQPGGANKWDISKLDVSKLPPAATAKDLTYDKDIKPIFEKSCFGCHGEMRQSGRLRVDSLDALLKGGGAGKVVVPSSGDKSLLVMAVSRLDPGTVMPPPPRARRGGPGGPGGPGAGGPPPGSAAPDGATPPPGGPAGGPPGGGPGGPGGPGGRNGGPPSVPLTPEQVALVRAWIDQGAK
jgi:hypothetical protein